MLPRAVSGVLWFGLPLESGPARSRSLMARVLLTRRYARRFLVPSAHGATLDGFLSSFSTSGRIKVLLVPVGPISRASYERCADLIRACTTVHLADVPPDGRGERAIFSSTKNTPGTLLFEYLTPAASAALQSLAFLSEFQVHRRIHGIIGIVDSQEYEATGRHLSTSLDAFRVLLADLPKTFATKVYAFDPSTEQLDQMGGMHEGEGLVMIPGTGDVEFFLNSVIADFSGQILWEFSMMAAQLESRTVIPTPQEALGPPVPFVFSAGRGAGRNSIASYVASPLSPTFPSSTPVAKHIDIAPLGVAPPPQSRTARGVLGGSAPGNRDGFLYGMSIESNMRPASIAEHPPRSESPAGLVDMRSKKKVAGREKKLWADLWLLAGRLPEAIEAYNEAILLTKSWQDSVWQASALEGLTVALVIQAAKLPGSRYAPPELPSSPPLNGSTSGTNPNASDPASFLSSVPDRFTQATVLYEKMLSAMQGSLFSSAPTSDPDRAHPLVYAEACLKCAKFLLADWEAGGKIEDALPKLVLPERVVEGEEPTPQQVADAAQRRSLAPSNPVPRSLIIQWATQAYIPQLATLPLHQRLMVLTEIAAICGRVGYRRKEAFFTRETAALCSDGVQKNDIQVVSRSPNPNLKSPNPNLTKSPVSNGWGRSPNPSPSYPSSPNPNAPSRGMTLPNEEEVNNIEAIIRLVERVSDTFGIDMLPRLTTDKADKRRSLLQGRAVELQSPGDAAPHFGWPKLQVGVLRDAIRIAERLGDYQAAIRFTVTALRTLSVFMPPAEQSQLSDSFPRLFASAAAKGIPFHLEYWGPAQLVVDIELLPLSSGRLAHPFVEATAAPGTLKRTDPFIYNPNALRNGKAVTPTYGQNESIEVLVTLRNPYLFNLEVDQIELSTSGARFACERTSTLIRPGSLQQIRLSGTPREPGTLTFRGCNIRLAGCSTREFALPLWNEEDEARRKRATLSETTGRTKASGLTARKTVEETPTPETGLAFLESTVVPQLPMLWMQSNSMAQGAVMLFDGEQTTLTLDLENISALPIDYLSLSFMDAHTSANQALVAENELSPSQAYDLEADNANRPVFKWAEPHVKTIKPGELVKLSLEILGKAGCGNGTVQIDYGTRGPTGVLPHTRRLYLDIYMTVHRYLLLRSVDLLSMTTIEDSATGRRHVHARSASKTSFGRRESIAMASEKSMDGMGEDEHCLLAVEIENLHSMPFDLALNWTDSVTKSQYGARQLIEPGTTEQLLLKMGRLVLPHKQLTQPIPSITERQFIVSKERMTALEERQTRELFWYREELLKKVSASWQEEDSARAGTLNLRSLKFTQQMLAVLRSDEVDVELSLVSNTGQELDAPFGRLGEDLTKPHYWAAADSFVDIRVRLINRSPIALCLSVTLSLAGTPQLVDHLTPFLVIDGVATVHVGTVAAGETSELFFPVCFLAQGLFQFLAAISEVGGDSRTWESRVELVVDVDR